MKTPIHPTRLVLEENGDFHKSPKGMLFMDPLNGQFTDLSGVRILRCGVDTVRQLYNGKLRPEVMALFDLSVDVVEFAGYEWSKGRIGRDSGYQYRLQNAEMGLILLIKNHNIKVDTIGSHLKIEVSPHAIDGADPRILQGVLDDLAAAVLSHCETNQAAVHIALDVQGWTPPADLVDRMHCRSRRVRQISGIERIEFDGNASVYGRGETYMFGSANGLQLSIYNKTLQARATDKLDYWESVWATLNGDPFGDGDPAYNPWKRCGGSSFAITTPSSSSSPKARVWPRERSSAAAPTRAFARIYRGCGTMPARHSVCSPGRACMTPSGA